jgi:hypothetical protein
MVTCKPAGEKREHDWRQHIQVGQRLNFTKAFALRSAAGITGIGIGAACCHRCKEAIAKQPVPQPVRRLYSDTGNPRNRQEVPPQ